MLADAARAFLVRRNWFDELKQWSSLVLLMGLMMLVLLKLGEFAERAKKGDAKL